MAIDWKKSNTVSQKADDVKKRLKDSMNNKKPLKPEPTMKVKPILKKDQVGFKVTIKS